MISVTKKCATCKIEKPTTEFYKLVGAKDGLQRTCKDCSKIAQKKRGNLANPNPRSPVSGHAHENVAIDKLKSVGIYAVSGKASNFKSCDVVAWGCIKIEIKTSYSNNEHYAFTIKEGQVSKNDFFLFVCVDTKTQNRNFHLVPSSHPMFFRVHYKKTVQKHGVGFTTGDKVMAEYQDAWFLVEQKRLEIIQGLTK